MKRIRVRVEFVYQGESDPFVPPRTLDFITSGMRGIGVDVGDIEPGSTLKLTYLRGGVTSAAKGNR